jgi:hypothetical protein
LPCLHAEGPPCSRSVQLGRLKRCPAGLLPHQSSPPLLSPKMGASAPRYTGIVAGASKASRIAHTLPTTARSSAFPCTHVIATISMGAAGAALTRGVWRLQRVWSGSATRRTSYRELATKKRTLRRVKSQEERLRVIYASVSVNYNRTRHSQHSPLTAVPRPRSV